MNSPYLTEAAAVRPLFYDALGGEFYPPSDKLGRGHTLGRLMVATYTKGAHQKVQHPSGVSMPREIANRWADMFTYTPSWADAEVTTLRETLKVGRPAFFVSLQLTSRANGLNVAVYDTEHETDIAQRGIRLVTPQETTFIPLALGDELDDARSAVTNAAKIFFDNENQN